MTVAVPERTFRDGGRVGRSVARRTRGAHLETHVHNRHDHVHGDACGHLAVRHGDHIDYVHDAHLHHPHGDHVDEHELGASDLEPPCDPTHACGAHPVDHVHGVGCEHVAIPHDGHIDYVVEGHIHRQHGEHCDDHGELRLA